MEENAAPITIESLVRDHAKSLYRLAYRWCGSAADSDDLVQETFLTAHRKLDHLRDPKAAFVWLVAILRSHLRELYKRRSRRGLELDADPSLPDQLVPPEMPKPEIDAESLHVALQTLPDEFRQPVVLYYFGDLRYREIAEICDCPIGTVMSRLARGKAMLRSAMFGQEEGRNSGSTQDKLASKANSAQPGDGVQLES